MAYLHGPVQQHVFVAVAVVVVAAVVFEDVLRLGFLAGPVVAVFFVGAAVAVPLQL